MSKEPQYLVQAVLEHRRNKKSRKNEYLIKWLGYDHTHNSWEPEDNINDDVAIADYFADKKREKEGKARLKELLRKKKELEETPSDSEVFSDKEDDAAADDVEAPEVKKARKNGERGSSSRTQ
ncbi:hypothetical protein L5515_012669 [Caenorhabditis briggsae]|uniref:Chromo domain-containing protein n=1 Tax=Caenorhabditis briggsae TaxID=6238 RepID=A0AAE9JI63_CAEBR|nr:hypothetical protein L5515_012669 [Caenorhabditis briggsae]